MAFSLVGFVTKNLRAPVAVALQLIKPPRVRLDAIAQTRGVVRREQRLRLVIIQEVIRSSCRPVRPILALERHRASGFRIAKKRGEN